MQSEEHAPAAAASNPEPIENVQKGMQQSAIHSPTDSVRINVGIIDKLMTLAGELVLMRNQFMRSVDMNDSVSRSLAHGLDIVTSESLWNQITDQPATRAERLYFSFVTLTTLGYGDIVPVNSFAKVIVIFTTLSGVLYLAVFVATLVGGLKHARN